jgi:hypothetical protein
MKITNVAPQPVTPDLDWPEIPKTTVVETSVVELSAAFTEWERRFREEPERFLSEATKLLRETPETYGDACAPYLVWILGQLAAAAA